MTYSLGIDIGTSKVAAVVSDPVQRVVVESSSVPTNADIPNTAGYCEQDVSKILNAINNCVLLLNPSFRKQVATIGITGQMHGVLLWTDQSSQVSNLVTWQDKRCSLTGALEKFNQHAQKYRLNDGYGFSTLAWYAKFQPSLLHPFNRASTIQDYLVSRIVGSKQAISDPTNAASWGFFDLQSKSWRQDLLEPLSIPQQLLPHIVPTAEKAGTLSKEYSTIWGIPQVPVMNAIGDNQASIYGTTRDAKLDIALTIGTGAQLSLILDQIPPQTLPPTAEIRPYVGTQCLLVAAALSGGSSIAWLVNTFRNWCNEIGVTPPNTETIYQKIDQLGLASKDSSLFVNSSFNGERHDPSLRGSISNIDLHNLTFGNLSYALAKNLIQNLRQMIPEVLLTSRTCIIGSGNGLRRLALVRQVIEDVFGLPIVLTAGREEAALGAALLAVDHLS